MPIFNSRISPYGILTELKNVRNERRYVENLLNDKIFKLQLKLILKILRRNVVFRSTEDMLDLLSYCGHPEFYGHDILTKVLKRSFFILEGFFDCYAMCSNILASAETVHHYLSTCNRAKLKVGHSRFPDFLLGWLVKRIRRCGFMADTHKRLLRIMDANLLKELLRHGTLDVYGPKFHNYQDENAWENETKHCVSPYLLADLLYLCLASLYNQEILKVNSSSDATATQTIVDCINLLFRAFRKIPLGLVYVRGRVMHYLSGTDYALDNALLWLSESCAVANLHERLGSQVPSLKHLSRCRIRNFLHVNWALPQGLDRLGLPRTIVRYLNLDYD